MRCSKYAIPLNFLKLPYPETLLGPSRVFCLIKLMWYEFNKLTWTKFKKPKRINNALDINSTQLITF